MHFSHKENITIMELTIFIFFQPEPADGYEEIILEMKIVSAESNPVEVEKRDTKKFKSLENGGLEI